VGKDIAYQLWKLGLLGLDFHYQAFMTYPNGHIVWVTAAKPLETACLPASAFGAAGRVYNVIDRRQNYLQDIVVEGLRALHFNEAADNSIHFSYEMVALSPRCCEELGFTLSEEDRKKPYVEVSGRKGLGVIADDLLNQLEKHALAEVQARHQLSEEETQRIAHQVAVSALRYFMLKFTRNSVIAFDFEEALSFEGETGPYLQYSVVRANNIFRKFEEAQLGSRDAVRRYAQKADFSAWLASNDDIWELLLLASRLSEVTRQVQRTLELSILAKYAFNLAQKFNLFYHRHHILSQADPGLQLFLLHVVDLYSLQMTRILELLGIQVPDRM
jgi:arginyl-tRNA synthetase